MTRRRNLLIAGIGAALTLLGAPSAIAESQLGVANRYGDATLISLGDGSHTLLACDTKKDGHSTVAYVAVRDESSVLVSRYDTVKYLRDGNGASNRSGGWDCAKATVRVAPAPVRLRVCRRNMSATTAKG